MIDPSQGANKRWCNYTRENYSKNEEKYNNLAKIIDNIYIYI